MTRQTGGSACAATSTRSRSRPYAYSRASSAGVMPSCAPSAPIKRTRTASICSLIRADTRVPTGLRRPLIRRYVLSEPVDARTARARPRRTGVLRTSWSSRPSFRFGGRDRTLQPGTVLRDDLVELVREVDALLARALCLSLPLRGRRRRLEAEVRAPARPVLHDGLPEVDAE